MRLLVVDASVALKWALPEPGREEAAALLDQQQGGQLELVAPALLLTEAASALARHFRRGFLNAAEAQGAFQLIAARLPRAVGFEDDTAAAFALSLQYRLSLWDCTYVALALHLKCALVTADERLRRALAPHFDFVRGLGAARVQ